MSDSLKSHPISGSSVSLTKRTDRQSGRGSGGSRLSNAYLQDSARLVVFLKLQQYITIVLLCVLIGLLANFSSTSYRVFATTTEGKLTAPPPVDQEINDNLLAMWVIDATTAATTMGFHDYDLRLQEVRPYFTDRGWESYTRFLRTKGDQEASLWSLFETDRLLIFSSPRTPPQIIQKGLVGGVITYQIRQGINLTEVIGSRNDTNHPVLEIAVERVRPEISASGLAISQWRLANQ